MVSTAKISIKIVISTLLASMLLMHLLSGGEVAAGDSTDTGRERKTIMIKDSIGSARMEMDGTIILQLRAESPGGSSGDALFRYPPNHPEYNNILKHLGGLEKGQEKPVPPWKDGE